MKILRNYTAATKMSFNTDHQAIFLVSHIEQSPRAALAWVKLILDESQGFTDIGKNESTTLYVRTFTLY